LTCLSGSYSLQEATEEAKKVSGVRWILDNFSGEAVRVVVRGSVYDLKYIPTVGDFCYLRHAISRIDGDAPFNIEKGSRVEVVEIKSPSLIVVHYDDGHNAARFTVVPEELYT
jgi:hypothetical protein